MSFWRDKRVLITGANGFLGANLAKRLVSRGARVTSFTRTAIRPTSPLAREGVAQQFEQQIVGSVENFAAIDEVVRENAIEIIYHLAALPLVEIGQDAPTKTFEVNTRGTWNVLEAARQNQVAKIVAVSTAHVYGDNPRLPYREAFYPQPSRPYETSKACADLLAQCYADTYNLGVEIPRLVNVYGPGDTNFTRIVPKTVRMVLAGETPTIWDSGAIRDFLYIDDAVDALLLLVEKNLLSKKRNRIFNFGSGRPVAINDLVKKIVHLAGLDETALEVEPMPEDREREILKQYVSIRKAKEELGWRPKVSLAEGLKRTLDWYRVHPEK